MEPIMSMPNNQTLYPLLFPGVFDSEQEGQDYLNSLDSDTRDYVMKHTDSFSSKEELMDCVRKLHEPS